MINIMSQQTDRNAIFLKGSLDAFQPVQMPTYEFLRHDASPMQSVASSFVGRHCWLGAHVTSYSHITFSKKIYRHTRKVQTSAKANPSRSQSLDDPEPETPYDFRNLNGTCSSKVKFV